jgi:hypothetical protein
MNEDDSFEDDEFDDERYNDALQQEEGFVSI